MRNLIIIFCVLLIAMPLGAQIRTGNIYGQVVDSEGMALPGVTLTITSSIISPISIISSVEGRFRFISLQPAKDYVVTAELQSFKKYIQQGIAISSGKNVELVISMEIGMIEEEVTVVAELDFVDKKRVSIINTMDREILQSMPSARDTFSYIKMAPGVQGDTEDVGGSRSGHGIAVTSGGLSYQNNEWSVDGVNIGDVGSIGWCPVYWDFDVFEEITITTGGADVESQSAGIQLNLITQRGSNKFKVGGRLFITDEYFQQKLEKDEMEELGVEGYNQINNITDHGLNFAGPLMKDKAWIYMAYGSQIIRNTTLAGTADNVDIKVMTGKLNLQLIPENRFEAMVSGNNTLATGRSSSAQFPAGYIQDHKNHWGAPVVKIQDEHMFGDNLMVSAKYGFVNGSMGLRPGDDKDMSKIALYNVEEDFYERSRSQYNASNPHHKYTLQATYFNEKFLGLSHELKLGLEYNNRTRTLLWANAANARIDHNFNTLTVDYDGDGIMDNMKYDFGIDIARFQTYRASRNTRGIKEYTAYIQDSLSFGRFNVNLGIRRDEQNPFYGDALVPAVPLVDHADPYMANWHEAWLTYTGPGTVEKLGALFPDLQVQGNAPDYKMVFWAPRVGITFDIFGDGSTIAKLSYNMYGERLGLVANYWMPLGVGGEMSYWWIDANKDSLVDWRELNWATFDQSRTLYPAFDDAGNFQGNWDREKGYMWSGFNYQDPQAVLPSNTTVDPNWSGNRTREVLFTLERDIFTDFGAAIDFAFSRYDRLRREQEYWPDTKHILDKNDYMVAGQIPATIIDPDTGQSLSTEGAAGKDWYVLKEGIGYTDNIHISDWGSDRYQDFYGVTFRFQKKMANMWMMMGSFSMQSAKNHFGNDGYDNPNNLWVVEDGIWDTNFSKWLLKLQGMYQLPYDFNVSFMLTGRQGRIIPAYFTIVDSTLPNPRSQSNIIYTEKYGDTRNPVLFNSSIRLEKLVRIGDIGKFFLVLDVFNVFNSHVLDKRYDKNLGTYYVDTGAYAPYARYNEPQETLNPRVLRFGMRFQF